MQVHIFIFLTYVFNIFQKEIIFLRYPYQLQLITGEGLSAGTGVSSGIDGSKTSLDLAAMRCMEVTDTWSALRFFRRISTSRDPSGPGPLWAQGQLGLCSHLAPGPTGAQVPSHLDPGPTCTWARVTFGPGDHLSWGIGEGWVGGSSKQDPESNIS